MASTKTSTATMLLKFLLLIASPIFITATDPCTDMTENKKCTINYRLPNDVIPVHYNISIMLLNKEEDNFNGETNITIKILHDTRNISLHSLGLEIDKPETKLIHRNNTIYKPAQHDFQDAHILFLYFNNALLPGLYTLCFKYVGHFSDGDQGFLKIPNTKVEKDTSWTFITHLKKIGARRVFPCWDEPAIKATFNISVKHHINYLVFSTMPIREEQYSNNSNCTSMWSHFKTTPLMSTYLVGIVVIDVYRSTDNPHSHLNVWCRRNLKSEMMFAQNVVHAIAKQIVRYTSTSLQLPKIDIIAVPDYIVDSSSAWGILLFKESLITYNETRDRDYKKITVANLIAHEMTKQWFGDVVGPTWWSDMWLNDGFTLFFQAYILDEIYEDWRVMDFIIHTLHKSLRIDDNLLKKQISYEAKSIYEIDFLESFIIVDKAQVLLRMLRYLVTEKVFQEGIITYLNKYQFSSATPESFWDIMQNALQKSGMKYRDFNIKEVMHTWVNQTGYPVVKVTRNYETGETVISQTYFRRHDSEEADKVNKTWWTPVTYATQTIPDFSNSAPAYWLGDQNTIKLLIDRHDWIIVNLQQTGYYRVNYDAINWQRIAAYLNSDEFTRIHVFNRAQIIDDAYYFLVEKQLDFSKFLDITSYLSQEVDYIAWFPMFRILSYLWRFFSLPLKESAILKSHMLEILKGLLHNIGYEDDPNDDNLTKLMRGTAYKWACQLGDYKCKDLITVKLNKRIAKSEKYGSVLPWETWIYCSGLITADVNTWNIVMNLYLEVHKDIVLELLTCSENPNIIIGYLNILGTALNNSVITEAQYSHVFYLLITKYARNSTVLDYILRNLQKLKPRLDSTTTVLRNIILNIYSEKQLDKIHIFLEENPEMPECLVTLITMRLTQLQDITNNFLERFATKDQI